MHPQIILKGCKKFVYNPQDLFPDCLITTGVATEQSKIVKIGRWVEEFSYHNADVIITISEDMKKNIISKGVENDKVKVVLNWVDTDAIHPVERSKNKLFSELELNRECFYVVYAGNVGMTQGIDVIVRAAQELREQKNIKFLIFGNGSEEQNIKAQIASEGLDNVNMYPLYPQERVPEVYGLADAAIISCKPGVGKSGFPSKTWTIMACGAAIISSFDLNCEFTRTIEAAQCGFCLLYTSISDGCKLSTSYTKYRRQFKWLFVEDTQNFRCTATSDIQPPVSRASLPLSSMRGGFLTISAFIHRIT